MHDLPLFWENKNVFVTGCTGFLGKHLVRELLQLGANVTGLVRNPRSSLFQEEPYKQMNFIVGSLDDRQLLIETIQNHHIDTVFHLAAQADVGTANKNPVVTFETNIRGTWNVLEACRQNKVNRVIVTSSEKAYGDQAPPPYKETHPLQGRSPYDVSKSCADLITNMYYHTYQLGVCIVRCGNLFGGGDFNFNRIIPQTIQSISQNKAPVIRGDGTSIRDFLYIDDAVKAHLLVAEKIENLQLEGEAFNFSYEVPHTILEVVRHLLNIMNSDLQPIILNEAVSETKRQLMSSKKARDLLGWKPTYDLIAGLESTINWYQRYYS
ncbi:NAD-dependent epimerase/dehydratase family protein [Bacillus sp. MRMR6]|uniref:NAD-dependent epimerase/dehydratase family protein n=1 Tax=Bacillus sp. MRMR6 TaxID=1928617 RepID=UPI000952CB33|nr:NAD-dependent epimerase/dehydratase family protein [Bacillus sp. MRMR6]OLS34738.1 sugar dehydratase [Bacillus sp. MRMR6]